MFKKQYPIQIWFLDADLQKSASYLTNKLLCKTINGCVQALLAARFYYIGIRSPKFYKYYFDKDRKIETLDRFFPCWPLKTKPMYNQYNSKTSKWARKCLEHYNYIKTYLDILLNEYSYRYKTSHKMVVFLNWLECDAPTLNIPLAKLSKITLPWKNLNPKYRRKNIIDGYILQYKSVIDNYGGVKIDDFKNRDIPEFLIFNKISLIN